ncbi:MAG TPA: lamin tail domain-containing protein [Verrucomicrobiae bacterium]|nr:lamin tail domain-containing protein [Verrucomicrobiae bacterium]
MAKKNLFIGLSVFVVLLRTQAQLAITEVMSGETDKNHPDWFELHNYGTGSIDLTGYSWNDDGHGGFSGADTAPFNGVSIAAGETIIVTEQKGAVVDYNTFTNWWGLNPGIQVVILNSADPGLGAGPLVAGTSRADSVRLWSTNLAALGSNTNGLDLDGCADYLVQRVDLGVTVSQSLLYDPATGLYDLLSSNGVNGAFASATVATDIGSPGIAPSSVPATIIQTPVGQTVTVGSSISFTNGGLALPALVFRWFFNDAPITSQTPGVSILYTTPGVSSFVSNGMSILTLSGVQTTNAGTYKVIASNGLESFTNTATLTVNSLPTPPSIQSVSPLENSFDANIGQTLTLSVQASGFPTPTYLWSKDNSSLPDQTNNNLAISLSDTNQSGVYSVVVTNSAGGTNVSFTVNVTPAPNLVITEVMSGESTNNSNGDTSGHGDWFELSNLGNFAVNLFGYRIDDSHNSLAQSAAVINQTTIQPGESVVFVQNMTPQAFRDWWGTHLSTSVQIISYNGNGQGLSGTSDEVHIWNAAATTDADQITSVGFGAGTDGNSFGFDLDFLDQSGFDGFTLTTPGIDGALAATVGGDIGSPGAIINLPCFTGLTQTSGGFVLSWASQPNWNYTIQYKTNLTDTAWTTLTQILSGDTNFMTYTNTTSDARRFYRVFLNLNNQ